MYAASPSLNQSQSKLTNFISLFKLPFLQLLLILSIISLISSSSILFPWWWHSPVF